MAVASAIYWLAKIGKLGPRPGCPDSECKKIMAQHSERLAQGSIIFESIQDALEKHGEKLDVMSENISYMRGVIDGGKGRGK